MRSLLLVCLVLLLPFMQAIGQQRTDTDFPLNIDSPHYAPGTGPIVCVDAAHNNFHTLKTGFAPFGRVLRSDGYQPRTLEKQVIQRVVVSSCDLLVIVNALHESNIRNWVLPTPSAFEPIEIGILTQWVEEGGSLLLIADHMPFAGAATDLAASFGFEFSNGFATLNKGANQPDLFSLENSRLKKNAFIGEEISSVTTFTGSAFKAPKEAEIILSFKEGDLSLEPRVAWRFQQDTDTLQINGYAQGALLQLGKGKVAVMGEAAMFTAQILDTDQGAFKIGLNNTDLAPQNLLFLRKLMTWLSTDP